MNKVIKSFIFAFRGLIYLFKYERNAKIHFLFAANAIILGFLFQISYLEWVAISASLFLVIISETFNTAIERLTDIVSPEINTKARIIKDLSAASVLLTSMMAFIIGSIVFGKEIISYFSR